MDLRCLAGLHEWSEWHQLKTSCHHIRTCQRAGCNAQNERAEHAWGDWNYKTEMQCTKARTCQVCGEEDDKTTVQHVFTPVYIASDSCRQELVCSRCGKKNLGVIAQLSPKSAHVWGVWQEESPCINSQTCSRCGNRKTLEKHTWTSWKYIAMHSCAQIRSCTVCNKEENQVSHVPSVWYYIEKTNSTIGRTFTFCYRCNTRVAQGIVIEPDKALIENRRTLRELVVAHFNTSELETIMFDLGLDAEEVVQSSDKSGKARDVISYMERCNRIPEFVQACSRLRPIAEPSNALRL